jgi:hypothetical protein
LPPYNLGYPLSKTTLSPTKAQVINPVKNISIIPSIEVPRTLYFYAFIGFEVP